MNRECLPTTGAGETATDGSIFLITDSRSTDLCAADTKCGWFNHLLGDSERVS